MNKTIDFDKLEKQFPNAYFEFFHGCIEPGYNDQPVILTNWNHVSDKVFDKLESLGYSCEWSDEWTACNDCGKAVRTSPNGYEWQAFYAILNDCELICGNCLGDYTDDYLQELINNPKRAITSSLLDVIDLDSLGYTLIEGGFESGLHPGQNDDPSDILEKLLTDNPEGKYLFVMDGQGQFDIEFSVWMQNE